MHTKRYVITIAMSPSKRYRFLLRKTIRKRYVNDGDKRYRNDATTIDYFLPGYKHQFGFRERHSTQQAIITLVEKITGA